MSGKLCPTQASGHGQRDPQNNYNNNNINVVTTVQTKLARTLLYLGQEAAVAASKRRVRREP